jgi:2-methylcitrate dehydratase PrpD
MDRSLYQGARWHAPGVVGPIGAATAAGLLAGFDAETLERAWGLAALQSGGTFAAIGSPGVKFTQARAALAGLLAADMTGAGLGGQLGGFTHPDGGLYVAYGGGDPRAAVRDLGARWSILDIGMRRWPAASSLQAVIEAVLELRGDGTPPPAIDLALPTQSYRLCADKGWPDQLTALQSARWVAAVVWQDGRCWLDQFSAGRLLDADTAELAGRVTVTEDPGLPQGSARVAAAGRTTEVLEALGSPARPLDTEDILGKLRLAAGAARADRVLSALQHDDLDALRAALTASG